MTETVYDTVVVGAGFSGITAARNLVDQGRSVVVLEAGERTGGRTYARPFVGHEHITAELGGSWVNREIQPYVRAEVARYGAVMREDFMPLSPAFITDGTLRSFPVPPEEIADLERLIGRLRDASRRISPSQRLSAQTISDLDISIDEFLAPLNVGPATRDLLHATVVWYMGADPRAVSIFSIITQIAAFGHSPYGFFDALTERFVGGAGTLLDKMIDGSRLDVRLRQHVTAVEQDEAGVLVRTQDGTSVRARSCVVAVPTNVLKGIDFRPVLPDDKARHFVGDHLGSIYKPSMLVRNGPARPFSLGVGKLGSICLGYEYDDGTSLLMGFGNRIDVTDTHSREEAEQALREYYPTAEVLAVDAHDWSRDPLFNGTNRVDGPGDALPFLQAMSRPEGRMVFAGTDVADTVWRTWIEGAMDSGHRASVDVGTILGRD